MEFHCIKVKSEFVRSYSILDLIWVDNIGSPHKDTNYFAALSIKNKILSLYRQVCSLISLSVNIHQCNKQTNILGGLPIIVLLAVCICWPISVFTNCVTVLDVSVTLKLIKIIGMVTKLTSVI